MLEFLKQLKLTNEAVDVYLKSLGKSPMTYYEIYSLVPNLPQENFKNIMDELVSTNLLIQLAPQKPEILVCYLAIPPFGPIINYYENIEK